MQSTQPSDINVTIRTAGSSSDNRYVSVHARATFRGSAGPSEFIFFAGYRAGPSAWSVILTGAQESVPEGRNGVIALRYAALSLIVQILLRDMKAEI
jgi:hypothetical protein